jgi:sec-independent protein translocase protein TatA
MMLPLLPTIGVPELLVILVIVLVLFGTGKLSAVGRQLGRGLRTFRKAQRAVDAVLEPDLDALADPGPEVEDAVEVPPRER